MSHRMIDTDHGDRYSGMVLSRSRWTLPEQLFAALGVVVVLALLCRSGVSHTALIASGLWGAYVLGVVRTAPTSRSRLLINYFAVWAFYGGSSFAIEALRLPLHQEQLLAWDRILFEETPGVAWQGYAPGWLNDLLSASYLSYHIHLHWVLAEALWKSDGWRAAYGLVLFTAFGIGFIGYFVFPAGDPRVAFPELFSHPVEGGLMTQFTHWIVGNLAAKYDAFPSVHILVTTVMLACDWRWNRTRLWCMVIPSLFMVASTLLLRLHFAVDLLAGAGLAVGVLALVRIHEIRIDD
jgi:hypothetical protein